MKRRHAFTLVELMVSMALIIFMMAILSQAFMAALGTFRTLKAQGDLAEKLRSTAQILQHDLAASHFDGNRRMSDPTFWNYGPPSQGFFQIYHGSVASAVGPVDFIEGADTSGVVSYRSTDHRMAFTVKLIGNDMGDFMTASPQGSGNIWTPNPAAPPPLIPVIPQLPGGYGIGAIQSFGPPESRYQPLAGPGGSYNYQWAAVAWHLQPQINPSTGAQETTVPDPNAGLTGVPVNLYTLYRRQVLLVPDNTLVALSTTPIGGVPAALLSGNFLDMSCLPDPNTPMIYFNSPNDITMPSNRSLSGWGGQPIYTPIPPSPYGLLTGSDIQLNDVVSFDVRVLPLYPSLANGTPPTTAPPAPDPFVTLNQLNTIFTNPAIFQYTAPPGLPVGAAVFDTWSSRTDGLNNYSTWNTPGVSGTSVPFWTPSGTTLTYVYPVGGLPGITANSRLVPTPVTGSGPIILAIQVTIRIWDYKTNQTRQVTIVQAM